MLEVKVYLSKFSLLSLPLNISSKIFSSKTIVTTHPTLIILTLKICTRFFDSNDCTNPETKPYVL